MIFLFFVVQNTGFTLACFIQPTIQNTQCINPQPASPAPVLTSVSEQNSSAIGSPSDLTKRRHPTMYCVQKIFR